MFLHFIAEDINTHSLVHSEIVCSWFVLAFVLLCFFFIFPKLYKKQYNKNIYDKSKQSVK